MNKPPISIQYSTTPEASTALNEGRSNIDLSKQPSQFLARNVVIKPESVQMEVEIDGRWQTIRLATKDGTPNTTRMHEAIITLSENAQALTLKSAQQVVNIKAANELLSLLTLLKSGTPQSSVTTSASLTQGNNPQLRLDQLGIKLAIDPALAKVLGEEHKLVAQLQANKDKVTLKLTNGFADALLTSTISKQKLVEQLISQAKSPQLLVDKQTIFVKFSTDQKPISLPLANLTSAKQANSAQWQDAKLNSTLSGMDIRTQQVSELLNLKQPIKDRFAQIQNYNPAQPTVNTTNSSGTLTYAKPLFNLNLQDIKQAVEQALVKWLSKPFKQEIAATQATQFNTTVNQSPSQLLNPNTIPLMLQTEDNEAPLPPLIKLLSGFKNSFPLNQTFFQSNNLKQVDPLGQQKLTLRPEKQGTSAQTSLVTEALKDNVKLPNQAMSLARNITAVQQDPVLTNLNNKYQANLPIERSLVSTLLKLSSAEKVQQTTPVNTQVLSEKIANLSQFKHAESIDMTKLVHQAFSRMIDSTNISANQVSAELASLLPNTPASAHTVPSIATHSFTQALDKLLVTLLAAPKALNMQNLPEGMTQEQRLTALLETLLPNSKNINTKQLIPQLQQTNANLLAELGQVQSALSNSVQLAPPSQQKADSETQLLLNLLMPMKVPPECKQTELQIGKYKKPAKAKMPEKTVWFVRLNFDYAHLGKLNAQAELMDKAVDCQIIGNTTQVCDLASPHLDALRRKLSGHGLQVNEIVLTEDINETHTFYEQHTIVNVKV